MNQGGRYSNSQSYSRGGGGGRGGYQGGGGYRGGNRRGGIQNKMRTQRFGGHDTGGQRGRFNEDRGGQTQRRGFGGGRGGQRGGDQRRPIGGGGQGPVNAYRQTSGGRGQRLARNPRSKIISKNRDQRPTYGERRRVPGQFRRGGARRQEEAQQQQQKDKNPTGIPFHAGSFKLPSQEQLKALQVKAELTKLGQAPRSYVEKIQIEEGMNVDQISGGSRLTMNDRFEKIQGTRPRIGTGARQGNQKPGKTLRLFTRPKVANRRQR